MRGAIRKLAGTGVLAAALAACGAGEEGEAGAPGADSLAAAPGADTAAANRLTPEQESQGWRLLFDGTTLNGWKVYGEPAKFYAQDGVLIGEALLESGSYLVTDRDYGDFVMEAEVKVDSGFNSGIQIRSRILPADTTLSFLSGRLERSERTFKKGMLVGYQIEVDPTDRAWSGGLYEPGGRGWLTTLENRPEAKAAFRRDGWNRFRIEARGDTLRSWVNDVPVVDTTDTARSTGPIALQSHAAESADGVGHKVYFRNLRILARP